MSLGGQSCLLVVPARGGSKGIPRKNLAKIDGKSLIQIVATLAQELDWVDEAIISSDDEDMIEEGTRFGLRSIFKRPEHLSADRASGIAVCSHALHEAETFFDQIFDFVLYLEPTSPLRTRLQVDRVARKLIEGEFDHVMAVSLTDSKSHPLKQFVLDDNNRFEFFDESGRKVIARQELVPTYHRNGVAYAISRRALQSGEGLRWDNWSAVVIDDVVVNIDTPLDLEWARFLWKKNIHNQDSV